jgi:hypothetical protein
MNYNKMSLLVFLTIVKQLYKYLQLCPFSHLRVLASL